MEKKRQEYYRKAINKCSERDVKWKKKQAVDKLKNKQIPNKENNIILYSVSTYI